MPDAGFGRDPAAVEREMKRLLGPWAAVLRARAVLLSRVKRGIAGSATARTAFDARIVALSRSMRISRTGTDGKARQPATVNRDMEIPKTFFRWAVTTFDLPEHHAKVVRAVKKLREPAERVRSLTTDERIAAPREAQRP